MSSAELEKDKKLASLAAAWLKNISLEREKEEEEDTPPEAKSQMKKCIIFLGLFQILLIILFATVGGKEVLDPATAPGTGTQGYNMFIGVEIMMFIGFGYLMTFLKWYGLGAVGFTMMITAVGLQWAVFTESFWHQLIEHGATPDAWVNVDFTIYTLLYALYAISCVLISFGAVIGKVSPYQLMVMTVIEICCHSFNYEVLLGHVVNLADVGGTYIDHMFGAYFGLSVAFMLGGPNANPEMGNTPDIFSLLGTLFLWIYWPSFVAGAMDADSDDQQRAIVNTILALSCSTVLSFWASSVLSPDKRFRPVDIQNATLAGGVAIGATANLTLSPFSAIMIGGTAGLVSTFGFNHLQPFLEITLGLHDSCGVHNLHGVPSIIGALASVLLAAHKSDHRSHDADIYGASASHQWRDQLLGIFICMGFAIVTGLLTGLLLRFLKEENDVKPFVDNMYWETADDFGRSLYGELAGIVQRAPSFAMDNAAQELTKKVNEMTSSHHGRRLAEYGGSKLDGSVHERASGGFQLQFRAGGSGSGHGGSGHGK